MDLFSFIDARQGLQESVKGQTAVFSSHFGGALKRVKDYGVFLPPGRDGFADINTYANRLEPSLRSVAHQDADLGGGDEGDEFDKQYEAFARGIDSKVMSFEMKTDFDTYNEHAVKERYEAGLADAFTNFKANAKVIYRMKREAHQKALGAKSGAKSGTKSEDTSEATSRATSPKRGTTKKEETKEETEAKETARAEAVAKASAEAERARIAKELEIANAEKVATMAREAKVKAEELTTRVEAEKKAKTATPAPSPKPKDAGKEEASSSKAPTYADLKDAKFESDDRDKTYKTVVYKDGIYVASFDRINAIKSSIKDISGNIPGGKPLSQLKLGRYTVVYGTLKQ